MEKEFYICKCHSYNHQAIFWTDEDNGELSITIHLDTHQGFLKRLLAGIRYAFGYKSRYGNWDTFIFNEEDKERLEKYLANKKIK